MPLTIVARPYDHPDVAAMTAEVQAEYVVLYGSPDEAAVAPEEFAAPDGVLLVGLLDADGEPVAMGGWRRFESAADVGEIKRMYVRAAARRRGYARELLTAIETDAARAGIRRLVLNTGRPQVGAIALYRAAGYTTSAAFGHYAAAPDAIFLGRDLDRGHDRDLDTSG